MAYWLIKSDPDEWSWDDQTEAGVTNWSGVRNAQAQKHLRGMREGDRALFYHSGKARAIVGIVEIVREAYPDPSDAKGKLIQVDVKAAHSVDSPVTLARIKAEPSMAELPLVRQSRLSVMPIDEASWKTILAWGGQR